MQSFGSRNTKSKIKKMHHNLEKKKPVAIVATGFLLKWGFDFRIKLFSDIFLESIHEQ